MSGRLESPNGVPIVGTLETIPGTAAVSEWYRDAQGNLQPEHDGGTTVHWNDQMTVKRSGDIVVVDEDGGEWEQSACRFIEEGEDES